MKEKYKSVTLALDAMNPETWESYEVEDIREFLVSKFAMWPSTARIYHKNVSESSDVTPHCKTEVEKLGELEGPFFVVVYPAGATTILVVVLAAVLVSVVLLAPSVPTPTLRNTQSQSPNNELSDRINKPRPMARIPDIYGTVISTPDLISVPYKIFKDHEEVEYSYMCIGRGEYDISASSVKDDTTLISDIAGSSVEVYAPYTSPNSSDTPQLSIGTAINTPVLDVLRSNSVNGQVLRPPNDQSVVGDSNIKFVGPNEIHINSTDIDFTDYFAASDSLTITGAYISDPNFTDVKAIYASSDGFFRFKMSSSTLPPEFQAGLTCVLSGAQFSTYDLSGGYTIDSVVHELVSGWHYCRVNLVSPELVNADWLVADGSKSATASIELYNAVTLDLNGTYTVLSVSDTVITLSSPSLIKPDWATLTETDYLSPTLSTTGPKWIGPFILESSSLTEVYSNFIALQGLYKDDGKNQVRFDVTCEIELTPINPDGSPRGSAETFQATVEGSATYRSSRAVTLMANPTFTGRCKVRARRVTPADLEYKGTVVDEIKWKDVYAVSPVNELDFGNVTTVQSVTYATAGALAIKDRKLNLVATRKIPLRVSGSTFTSTNYPTNNSAEIISAICLDPYIGNRSVNELDFDSIYDSIADVEDYFGTSIASEFNYTFDANNLSFEEIVRSVAESVFCTAYRMGSVIKLFFEKENIDSTLLFNHRNKLPGSETRTIRFGNQDNYDGVSFKYVSNEDGAQVTYYIPEDRSAINPKEFESLGITNTLQAYFHAWRMWNKIRYQNTITEFTATQEANLLIKNDRILVADNTRTGTQDGEVLSQNILQLTLSQDVDLTSFAEYSIFLQLPDGTIESIPITAGTLPNQVILEYAPRLPLALAEDLYARTTYMISGVGEVRESAFLVNERNQQSNFTSTVKAINYDSRYYEKDKDYVNGVVDEDGNII